MKIQISLIILIIGTVLAQERSISGGGSSRKRFSAGKAQAVNFNCPEDFGYYPHPSDCSQYYVCVFGGALLESCTGGLMYSNELQTCDWPRNVVCNLSSGGVSTVKITDSRTRSRAANRIETTEALTPSSSILSRGIDNTIRSRQPQKSSGTSKSIFDDSSKSRQGRFLVNRDADPQRIDTGFQAEETSSRTFNVVPSTSSKHTFPWENYIKKTSRNRRDVSLRRQTPDSQPPRRTRSYFDRNYKETFDYPFPSSAIFSARPRDHQSSRQKENEHFSLIPQSSFTRSSFQNPYESRDSGERRPVLPLEKRPPHQVRTSSFSFAQEPRSQHQPYQSHNFVQFSSPISNPFVPKRRPVKEETRVSPNNRNNFNAFSPPRKTPARHQIRPIPVNSGHHDVSEPVGSNNFDMGFQASIASDFRDPFFTNHRTTFGNNNHQQTSSPYYSKNNFNRRPHDKYENQIDNRIPTLNIQRNPESQNFPKENTQNHRSQHPFAPPHIQGSVLLTPPDKEYGFIQQPSIEDEFRKPPYLKHDFESNSHLEQDTQKQPYLDDDFGKYPPKKDEVTRHSPIDGSSENHPNFEDEDRKRPKLDLKIPTKKIESSKPQLSIKEVNRVPPRTTKPRQVSPTKTNKNNFARPKPVRRPSPKPSSTTEKPKTKTTTERPIKSVMPKFRPRLKNKKTSLKMPPQIPGTARHPELSKLKVKENDFPSDESSTQSNTNRFSPAQTSSPAVDKSFYSDLLNLNDTEYYYYYDDILYDDYYEPTAATTTTKRPIARSPSRSRGKQETKRSGSPSAFAASTVNSQRRGSSRLSSNPSISSSSLTPSSSTSSLPSTFQSSRSSGSNRGSSSASNTKKTDLRSSSRNKPSRGSSRNKPSPQAAKPSSSGGPPELKGRTPQRPTPLYPQPQADTLAETCDRNKCKLPDCSCGEAVIPGDIPVDSVPQMVLLTFDDAVNDLNKGLYRDLFEMGRVNANGCPIAATFYVSHEWTDYTQVQNLYADGHEIASHSVTHSFGEQFSTSKWAKEIGGQREIMSAYGGVRMEDIRGMRAPFLAVGGNNMFRMLYDLNFTYDSSMPVYNNNPPSWPYTLDYKIFHDCMIPPCPTNSYPGVWQVPMVMWQDLLGGRCSMGDACTTPPDAEGVYKMLIKNFERHYTTNRAPMGLFYHAAWFTTPHHKEGFIAFLDTIAAMDDVWLVTSWQSLEWVRNPVPLSQAKSFKPFQCDYPERPPRCTSPRVCNVWHKGSVRYMKTCHTCPESYPWTGQTGVQSPLNDL